MAFKITIETVGVAPARLSTITLARFRQAVHSGGLGTITLARQQQTPRGQWTLHG